MKWKIITATRVDGDVFLGGNVRFEKGCFVTGKIKAGGWIKAGSSIGAGSWIKPGKWIKAGSSVLPIIAAPEGGSVKNAQRAYDDAEPTEVVWDSVVACLDDYSDAELADLILKDKDYGKDIIIALIKNDRKFAIKELAEFHDAESLDVKIRGESE